MARNVDVSRTVVVSDLISEQEPGTTWYVDGSNGNNANDGLSWDTAKLTIQAAVNAASPKDRILIAPLTNAAGYNESVVITQSQKGLTLIGASNRLRTSIAPTSAAATPLFVHADDTTIINLDLATNGAGAALKVTGRRFHDIRCKFEGDQTAGGRCYVIGPGANATIHVSDENGSDSLSEDGEFAWNDYGVILQGSDYGPTTENRFVRPRFHNILTAHFEEGTLAGGLHAAGPHFESLEVRDSLHGDLEDGTVPTGGYFVLNDANTNTGIVTGARLPTAINGGKNLVSTALKWVGNYHTGGLSAAQPS